MNVAQVWLLSCLGFPSLPPLVSCSAYLHALNTPAVGVLLHRRGGVFLHRRSGQIGITSHYKKGILGVFTHYKKGVWGVLLHDKRAKMELLNTRKGSQGEFFPTIKRPNHGENGFRGSFFPGHSIKRGQNGKNPLINNGITRNSGPNRSNSPFLMAGKWSKTGQKRGHLMQETEVSSAKDET